MIEPNRKPVGQLKQVCELSEARAARGTARVYFYRGALKDLLGTVWACHHRHTDKGEAEACAAAELARRSPDRAPSLTSDGVTS